MNKNNNNAYPRHQLSAFLKLLSLPTAWLFFICVVSIQPLTNYVSSSELYFYSGGIVQCLTRYFPSCYLRTIANSLLNLRMARKERKWSSNEWYRGTWRVATAHWGDVNRVLRPMFLPWFTLLQLKYDLQRVNHDCTKRLNEEWKNMTINDASQCKI